MFSVADMPILRRHPPFVYVENKFMNGATSKIHVRYSDTPAMLFMTLTGNCGYTRRDKTSSNIYDDYFVLSTLVTSPVSYRNFGVNGNISKYFGIKAFVMEISGGYDRYRSGEYLQEKYFSYSGEHAYASLKARTSALDWLSADLSVNYDFDRMVGNRSSGRHSVAAMASLIISPVKPMHLSIGIFDTDACADELCHQ